MVDTRRDAEARFVAKSHEDPDLEAGPVEASGRVGLRPSRTKVKSLSDLKNKKVRRADRWVSLSGR